MNTTPREISLKEWVEIMQVPEVKEGWGLGFDDEGREITNWRPSEREAVDFSARVYGVKFDFTSGSPGYVGDLYILEGDAMTDLMRVTRNLEGKLEAQVLR